METGSQVLTHCTIVYCQQPNYVGSQVLTHCTIVYCQQPNYVPVYGACLEVKLLNFGSSIGVGKGPETGLPVGRV